MMAAIVINAQGQGNAEVDRPLLVNGSSSTVGPSSSRGSTKDWRRKYEMEKERQERERQRQMAKMRESAAEADTTAAPTSGDLNTTASGTTGGSLSGSSTAGSTTAGVSGKPGSLNQQVAGQVNGKQWK